jgi:hypothetical protein
MSSRCTLVADRTDDAVQMLLGFIALSSLYAKWHFERPRRPAKVWFMDAMKQGTSAAMIHVMNILYAIGLVDLSDTPSDEDQVRAAAVAVSAVSMGLERRSNRCVGFQCAFYFMNVVIDTTLGVYIAYLLLQMFTIVAVRWLHLAGWQLWKRELMDLDFLQCRPGSSGRVCGATATTARRRRGGCGGSSCCSGAPS